MFSKPVRKNKLIALIILTVALVAPGLMHDLVLDPSNPVLCPMRAATGLPCPSCGIGRAFACIPHGEIDKAFDFHPFSLPVYILALLMWLTVSAELILKKELFPELPGSRKSIWYIFSVIVIFQIFRIYSFIDTHGLDGLTDRSLIAQGLNKLTSLF